MQQLRQLKKRKNGKAAVNFHAQGALEGSNKNKAKGNRQDENHTNWYEK